MLDFLQISTRILKNGTVQIYPKWRTYPKSKDLMVRGKDFYAIWVDELNLWSTDEAVALQLIDKELDKFAIDNYGSASNGIQILYMWDSETGMIDSFHKYCQKQVRDTYIMLDKELVFSNTEVTRDTYATKALSYPLEEGPTPSWDKIVGTLYSPEERHKIEWCIGSIVSGDSRWIQKFLVFYGSGGTGKSTILNIVQKLFDGYWAPFKAKDLASNNNQYALESFKNNPLVAIQHDGNLSRIEDNATLNSLVSHEPLVVNEKYKGLYNASFLAFLMMGTNSPVRITDAKSGLLRRLIDVTPTGKKIPVREYNELIKKVDFELGGIAYNCLQVYKADTHYYDTYTPKSMMSATNDFYDFVCESYAVFKREDGTTLKSAWEMYKNYCEEAKVPYPVQKRLFKEELKNYFWNFEDNAVSEDGTKLRSYYSKFKTEIFENEIGGPKPEKSQGGNSVEQSEPWLKFEKVESIFDKECADCPAQYASSAETPIKKWDDVTSKLSELDTSKLHYVKVPENHIVIDFDIKDENGNKSFEKNLEAANKFPPTYAELSKSGGGIHLHYIYTGDPSQLSRIYDEDIEVKVFSGGSSLRRKLSKCVALSIATIGSGLPLKEGGKTMINFDGINNERALRSLIRRHINKEIMGNTAPSVQMIKKVLDEAYTAGYGYDVSDLRNDIYGLAASSTNQAEACLKLVNDMKFKSEEVGETESNYDELVFYDVEVFPNLFLICWKIAGLGKPIVKMINPTPSDIEELMRFKLVGFNNRSYDNHMIYGCLMGYDNGQLYNLSQRLISNDKAIGRNAKFGEAYNASYTDIYDFASAGNKKSLKKLEIEMNNTSGEKLKKKGYSDEEIKLIKAGTHHQELGLPWDEPVPEEMWEKVADYCTNDVVATEAAFHFLKGDWIARQILADISGLTVNDTTNTLSQRIIFGSNKNPQSEFNYRFLADPVGSDQYEEYRRKFGEDYKFRVFNADGLPEYRDYIPGEVLPKGWSILPFFPGYEFDQTKKTNKSTYLGESVGEGGRVYAEPGMYGGVWDGDVTGMHPSSIIAEVLFGPRYTKAFQDIVDGRVSIKHKAWADIDELFDGKLKPYIQKVIDGELTAKELANALKTVVNSVYGLTSASFANTCRDPRNKDNIVAKRGALFMTLLTKEVQKRGFVVCHNKTDSIKIPDATPEIEEFVLKFGIEYGYSFETEARFEKFCLVNDAVYIAKEDNGDWTATGKQFAVPYVYKKLFSHEDINFSDLCETFSVSKGALYLDMNETLPDVSEYEKQLDKLETKYKKGQLSDITFESEGKALNDEIEKGHDLKFVGRVGQFCPIKPNRGGGVLYRVDNGKNYAASGSTGFRWLESEMIKDGNEDAIDLSYYNKLVDDAIDAISEFGDFSWFVSDDPYIPNPQPDFMNIPETPDEELPWDE